MTGTAPSEEPGKRTATAAAACAEDGEEAWLKVEGATVRFPIRRGVWARVRGAVHAVEAVSFSMKRGETLGLAGESGCGKTTLGRAVAGLESLSAGRICLAGRIWTDAEKHRRPARAERRRVQMVFQDPQASLNPRLPVCDLVTEGWVEHRLTGAESREEAAVRLLGDVGLGRDALWKYPFEFSGGQRQRICLARAMALHPELVVCDEVASALDVSVQAQVINLLMDLRERHGVAYLMIGHDLSVLRHVSHRIAVMYLGRLVEIGPAGRVVEAPQHPYTQALVAAVPIPGRPREGQGQRRTLQGEPPSAATPPEGCPFHPRCPYAEDICRRKMPDGAILKGEDGHWVGCHRAAAATGATRP